MNTLKLIAVGLIGMITMQNSYAQDKLVFTSGAELNVQITKLTSAEITFIKWHDADSATYLVNKNDLKKIYFQNGDVDVIKDNLDSIAYESMTSDDLYAKGKRDAKKYYSAKGTGAGILLSTIFLTPIGGILPAIACSSTKPNLTKQLAASPDFLSCNINYIKGYKNEAHQIKINKVWGNFAIGFGVDAILLGIAALTYDGPDMSSAWSGNSYSGGGLGVIKPTRGNETLTVK